MALWNRKEQAIKNAALAAALREERAAAIRQPRPHHIWVADWTVYLNDSTPIEVLSAYLRDPISWEAAEPAGTIKPSDLYIFKTQRAPHHDRIVGYAVEHIVAQFNRYAVKGVVSQHWRWVELGVW